MPENRIEPPIKRPHLELVQDDGGREWAAEIDDRGTWRKLTLVTDDPAELERVMCAPTVRTILSRLLLAVLRWISGR